MTRMPTFSEIGQRIKVLREKRGLSQEQLAGLIDLSRPVVIKIEGGKKVINSLELRLIADALKTTINELTYPVQENEETLMDLFRTKQGNNDLALVKSVGKIEQLFKEIVGQIRLWSDHKRLPKI